MDGSRFDALTKTLGTAHSRRYLTRLLGGFSLGGVLSVLPSTDIAAGSRIGGSPCDSNTQCATGRCLGSGKCSCSEAFPTCKQPRNPCRLASCDFATNRCVPSNKIRGTACADDGNPCTKDICDGAGQCSHPNKKNDTSCPNDGRCCDGTCLDVRADASNCGRCGRVCAGECFNGACSCFFEESHCPTGCSCFERRSFPEITAACGAEGATCQDQKACPNGDADCPVGSACGTQGCCIAACEA